MSLELRQTDKRWKEKERQRRGVQGKILKKNDDKVIAERERRGEKEMEIKGGESMCESHWMTLNTFSPDQSPRILSVPLLSRRRIQGQTPKPTVIIISHREVSVRHNSPTTAKSVPCSDVPPVMLFLAVHTYRPLSLVEKV